MGSGLMWKILSASVAGSRHRGAGEHCQDSCLGKELRLSNETALVVRMRDGAGSARLGGAGARVACEAMAELIEKRLRRAGHFSAVSRRRVNTWFRCLRRRLEGEARKHGSNLRELASTLLVAIIGESGAVFLQIGDGAIVVCRGTSDEVVFWSELAEYDEHDAFRYRSPF